MLMKAIHIGIHGAGSVRGPLQLFVSMGFHRKRRNIRFSAETDARSETQQQDAETEYAEDKRPSLVGDEGHRQNDAEHASYRQIGQVGIRPHSYAEPRWILLFQSCAQAQLRERD